MIIDDVQHFIWVSFKIVLMLGFIALILISLYLLIFNEGKFSSFIGNVNRKAEKFEQRTDTLRDVAKKLSKEGKEIMKK